MCDAKFNQSVKRAERAGERWARSHSGRVDAKTSKKYGLGTSAERSAAFRRGVNKTKAAQKKMRKPTGANRPT